MQAHDICWHPAACLTQSREATRGHSQRLAQCAFHPMGEHVATTGYEFASGSEDHSVRVWDLRKRRCLNTVLAHCATVSRVCYQKTDGDFLVSSSYDNTCKFWCAHDQSLVRVLSGHESRIMGLDISPDGSYMATSSFDRSWKLWARDPDQALAALAVSGTEAAALPKLEPQQPVPAPPGEAMQVEGGGTYEDREGEEEGGKAQAQRRADFEEIVQQGIELADEEGEEEEEEEAGAGAVTVLIFRFAALPVRLPSCSDVTTSQTSSTTSKGTRLCLNFCTGSITNESMTTPPTAKLLAFEDALQRGKILNTRIGTGLPEEERKDRRLGEWSIVAPPETVSASRWASEADVFPVRPFPSQGQTGGPEDLTALMDAPLPHMDRSMSPPHRGPRSRSASIGASPLQHRSFAGRISPFFTPKYLSELQRHTPVLSVGASFAEKTLPHPPSFLPAH
ncbi:putative U4/U6 small nuclear ribonucleoprotein Prp4 [Paratrimastix pyriformis]|uniref:U4/U6 small nuclear ribonucleoprotein Prp4 n=1 Tax=Paratrimastix pyriformis TaxID=342808 RepID=A0ABQ8U0H8_9EUKA|nr:putative U4/U6 small nuclear ribonucleoprotein Prp4 [Paratrimastix pyriformis]